MPCHYLPNSKGLVALYGRVVKGLLPKRCDPKWFFTTFCGVEEESYVGFLAEEFGGSHPTDEREVERHLNGFVKPYDPLTLASALGPDDKASLQRVMPCGSSFVPERRDAFFVLVLFERSAWEGFWRGSSAESRSREGRAATISSWPRGV